MQRKNLLAGNSNVMVCSSLFWMDGKKVESTWDLLAKNKGKGEARNARMFKKQIAYGCDTMTFICFHSGDPECVINPWKGNPTTQQVMAGRAVIDIEECNRWSRILQDIKTNYPGAKLIPCIFCGDDAASTRNEAFHAAWLPLLVDFLWPYSKAFLIATEASKSMDVRLQERMIARMKAHLQANKKAMGYPALPIGVHNQGFTVAGNADFLAYEFSWHPSEGDGFTSAQVVSEAKDVLKKSPRPIWFQEINMNVEGQRAREQVRALRTLAKTEPKLIGIPGPM
jgi:hypothetical protein